MYVDGRYLYTSGGEKVILKGFNAMIVYWDIHGNVNFPEMEKTGANSCRIFWNLAFPTPKPTDLDLVLGNCIKNHMIPIICLWDATGKWDKLQTCVDYWCAPAIVAILQKYEKNLLVNIANEAGDRAMGNTVFSEKYASIVLQMRNAGIHTPLIIDSDGWGRNADAVLDNGSYLLEQDPDHNLIFSWHLWDPENWGNGTKPQIDRIINKAVSKNICFIIGEFGPCEQCDKCSATLINWEYLIEKAYKNEIGYLAWVWKWTDCHAIVNNSTGKYGSWANTSWGESIAVTNLYSIKNTSVRPAPVYSESFKNTKAFVEVLAHPNPFSNEIFFELNLPEPSEVEIRIVDLKGCEIDLLVQRNLKSGLQILHLNSIDKTYIFSPGIYLYSVKIKNSKGISSVNGKIVKY
jgi:mannan endo-1,4-beta-mannosidase